MDVAAGRPETAATRTMMHLTGNHYVSFPAVSAVDGAIQGVNVLHRGALGLLEWAGDRDAGGVPLLVPEFRVDTEPATLGAVVWEPLERWIPRFRGVIGSDLRFEGTLCAPGGADGGVPGAVYLFEIENLGGVVRSVEVALAGNWAWSLRTVLSSRPLVAANRLARVDARAGIALEFGGDPGLAALAILAGSDDARCLAGSDGQALEEIPAGGEIDAPNGRALRFRIERTVRIPAGRRATIAFFLAAAVERDGALVRAEELRRTGAAELVRLGRLNLAQATRRVHDPVLGALLNRNLFFNAFYAVGRAIDDDRLYPVASRSPAHPQPAVFRERDALLWSLPALQLVDPGLAREVLLRVFEQQSHRPGAQLHYLDGGVISPAFALDHFCAYAAALHRYVQESGDESVYDEPVVVEVLRDLDDLLLDRLHSQVLLAATDILPSGEPADHPYVTYDNVLVWSLCRALQGAWPEGAEGAPPNFTGSADEVASAIWRHCTAEVDGLRVLAWSTDLAGESAVYDDPEGSLQLLPALGFCDAEDPIWRNTIDLLHSAAYPFWLGDRPFPGLAGRRHPEQASFPALCSALVGPRRDEALSILRRLGLDGGLACQTYDPTTGHTAHGPQYAAAAGLLAWTLWKAIGEREGRGAGRRAGR